MNSSPTDNYATQTEAAVTLWLAPSGETYAYPVGKSAPGFEVADLPNLNDPRWTHRGVLPQGLPITDTQAEGRLFRCTLAGVTVLTCSTVVIRHV